MENIEIAKVALKTSVYLYQVIYQFESIGISLEGNIADKEKPFIGDSIWASLSQQGNLLRNALCADFDNLTEKQIDIINQTIDSTISGFNYENIDDANIDNTIALLKGDIKLALAKNAE